MLLENVWVEARALLGAPNINWCEAPLPGLVEEPANTWSNLAYLTVALVLTRWARERPHLGHMARAVFWMGSFSLVYHASNNALTQAFDFLGMFLYSGLLLTWNARRLGLVAPDTARTHYLAFLGANALLFFGLGYYQLPVQMIMAGNTLVLIGSEIFLFRRAGQRALYGAYLLSLLCILLATVSSALDLSRTWCDPHSLLQGHAVWHLFTALAIVPLARFYAQFERELA